MPSLFKLLGPTLVASSCLTLVSATWADEYDPPSGYYNATVGLTGTALDTSLNTRIKGQSVRSYDQLRQDLAVTDRDWSSPPPAENAKAITNIFLVYSFGWSGYSRSGIWDSGSTWNREHTWPDSRGVGQPDSGPDFSDMHHLRAANPSANTARSNNWFDNGGQLAPVTAAPNSRLTTDTWEPPDTDKGWIARACLYMATRYDGTETNTTDLVLVETPPSSTTGNPPQMGRLSTLLKWNRQFPPGEWERRRNQIIYDLYQGNRNPFIDHPEFADVIYELPQGRETIQTWRYRHFALNELGIDSISGDLADTDLDGTPNLLEYALAGDPRATDTHILPYVAASSTPGTIQFVYRRQRDRNIALVSYQIEATNDISGTWQAVTTGTEVAVATVANVETVTVEIPAPHPEIFLRLRVTR